MPSVNSEKYSKLAKPIWIGLPTSLGDPTRIHQQVRKLRELYGKDNITSDVVKKLLNTSTENAKIEEQEALKEIIKLLGEIPEGNQKSYKP
jgi:chorismate mutase